MSTAVSRDSGLSWGFFKTVEVSEGLEDVARIIPEFPIPRVIRGRASVGQLPSRLAEFTYPNVDIVGDRVFIRYSRKWLEEKEGKVRKAGEVVLRIHPLGWFYR